MTASKTIGPGSRYCTSCEDGRDEHETVSAVPGPHLFQEDVVARDGLHRRHPAAPLSAVVRAGIVAIAVVTNAGTVPPTTVSGMRL